VKYAVLTFGCRVNQADSIGVEEDLLAAGAVPGAPDAADVVVVNTCSVTATSEQGARQAIRRVVRDNPGVRIVVTGCYATRRPDEVARLPNVVGVTPNGDKPRLVSVLLPDRARIRRPGDDASGCRAVVEPGVAGRTAFTLRVQTGCAEACSFCIIPSTRGPSRSVPVAGVLSEVARAAAAGFKEIALAGVHLGSYGRELTPPSSLADLLRALDGLRDTPSNILFRLSSLEPMDCSPEIVDLLASSARFAPHVHLPLQHASGRVLAAMRRPYALEYFAALVDGIRRRMSGASIGSDVIVGFPGETEEDFEQLAAYLERSPLTHLHVFPYSDRAGTAASAMAGRVDGRVIRERGRRAREIGRVLSDRFRTAQIGTIHRALTIDDGTLAVTGNYLKVRIPPGRARNEWVRVRIASQHDGELLGG